jgi:phosphoribosylglycinamide formyltransferase-1
VKNLAIFASGAGSNAQSIIGYFNEHQDIRVSLVVTNKSDAGVIWVAEQAGIQVKVINKEDFLSDSLAKDLKNAGIDWIILAGFLWRIPTALINAYPNHILNIHPALLPKFGGKGMYGRFVHEAVLASGEKESGISIHFVDGHYDNGDLVFQAKCPVLPNDTPETLAKRVQELEHAHYAPNIERLVRGH